MSAQHTQGRAVATGNGIHIGIRCLATTHMDPPLQRQEDARRLTACWNACEGVPTEVLEAQHAGGLPWHVADQIDQRMQRDELLAALQAIVSAHDSQCLTGADIERGRATIAKVKAE